MRTVDRAGQDALEGARPRTISHRFLESGSREIVAVTMLPESHEYTQPPPPAITGAAPVEIRRYRTVAAFQVDAASMASAGWTVIAQTEASAGINGSGVAAALILALLGLVLYWPLLLVAILVLILAVAGGRKQLVVTYGPARA